MPTGIFAGNASLTLRTSVRRKRSDSNQTDPRSFRYDGAQGGPSMATDSVEGKAVLEVRVTKPNGEKWHHASLYVPQFEATATFRAIIKKIKKDYPDINQ